jgi:hypothetical protein
VSSSILAAAVLANSLASPICLLSLSIATLFVVIVGAGPTTNLGILIYATGLS